MNFALYVNILVCTFIFTVVACNFCMQITSKFKHNKKTIKKIVSILVDSIKNIFMQVCTKAASNSEEKKKRWTNNLLLRQPKEK